MGQYRPYAYEAQAREFMSLDPTVIDQCAACARWLAGPGVNAGAPPGGQDIADLLQAYLAAAAPAVRNLSHAALADHLEELADTVQSIQSLVDGFLIPTMQYGSDVLPPRRQDAATRRPDVTARVWVDTQDGIVLCFAILWRIAGGGDFADPFVACPGLGCFCDSSEV